MICVRIVAPLQRMRITPFPLRLTALRVGNFAAQVFLLQRRQRKVVTISCRTPKISASRGRRLFFKVINGYKGARQLICQRPTYTFRVSFHPIIRIPNAQVRRGSTLRANKGTATATRNSGRRTRLATVTIAVIRRVFQGVLGDKVFTNQDPKRVVICPARGTLYLRREVNFASYRVNDRLLSTKNRTSVNFPFNDVLLVGDANDIVERGVPKLRQVPFNAQNMLGNFQGSHQLAKSNLLLRVRNTIPT